MFLKSTFYLFVLILGSFELNAQSFYFSNGINTTSYDFKSTDDLPLEFKSKTGQLYELGYKLLNVKERMNYAIGFAINNFNSNAGDSVNQYEWETTYMGINNHFEYIIIPSDRNPIELSGAFQMQFMHIFNGVQKINGKNFDLTKEKEFTGIWIQPGVTFASKYFISDSWQISLGYNYSIGYNLSNTTEEVLKYNNHQFRFCIHFVVE